MARVQAEMRGLAAQVQDHLVYQQLRATTLSAERYRLLLWTLRQVHRGVEAQAWSCKAESVRRIRAHLQPKLPVLERDLVAACGIRLEVPRRVNEPLDGFLTSQDKPTTPARVLGRLLLIEALRVAHALPYSGYAANPQLPAGSGTYLAMATNADAFQKVCGLFAQGLAGEVPKSNAQQAAVALRGVLLASLDAVVRTTAHRHRPVADTA